MSTRSFIVAEIGKNFIQKEEDCPVGEYLDNAKYLVDLAKDAGADAVKFQTHFSEDEILPNANFISPHFSWEEGRVAWIKKNERATPLNEFWKPLKEHCDKVGIKFFSTPMSRGAAKILDQVGVPLWKVASSDLLDFVLLDYMRNSKKPIILSSGMSTLEELDKAIAFVQEKNSRVILLHCVSQYPCPPENLRLKTMELLKERYGIPIGFSDHSLVTELAAAAVALGAVLIEKHFTLDRNLWGPDHKASLNPAEFKRMVNQIREVEDDPMKMEEVLNSDMVKAGLGDGSKILQDKEKEFRPVFRKSLVYAQDFEAGTLIDSSMLYAVRPQSAGIMPSEMYKEVLGKKISTNVKKYDLVSESNLEPA